MEVIRSIEFEAPSDLKALKQVLFQFNQVYREDIPLRDWLQCRLALAEGFTNAVRHAHKDLPLHIPIRIKVIHKKTLLEMRIWDFGAAFDLHNFIVTTARQHSDWLASGRGIPILHKIADQLDYYRTAQNQNCLLIVKNLSMCND